MRELSYRSRGKCDLTEVESITVMNRGLEREKGRAFGKNDY